jgi:hypothetical protein
MQRMGNIACGREAQSSSRDFGIERNLIPCDRRFQTLRSDRSSSLMLKHGKNPLANAICTHASLFFLFCLRFLFDNKQLIFFTKKIFFSSIVRVLDGGGIFRNFHATHLQ